MIKLKKILFLLVGLIILIISCALIFSYIYKDEVIYFVKSEINKKINTKIEVERVNFSVLRNFPNASLEFVNVKIHSSKNIDTKEFKSIDASALLFAENIFLEFSIIDVLKKNYKISEIKIKKSKINILIDSKRRNNYRFWKENETNDSSSFEFNLKNLIIKESEIFYIDKNSQFNTNFHANKMQISGDFSSQNFSLKTEIDAFLNSLTIDKKKYLKPQEVELNINLSNTNDKYFINDGTLILSNNNFNINGRVDFSQNVIVDLKISADKLKIKSFQNIFSKEIENYFSEYDTDGKISFDAIYKGEISKTKYPKFDTQFQISNGYFFNKTENIELKNINIEGNFSNGKEKSLKSSTLKAQKFSTIFKNSKISGKFSIENFVNPKINFKIDSEIELSDLSESNNLSEINKINGKLFATVNGFGKIYSGENQLAKTISKLNVSGKLNLIDANISLINFAEELKDINANFTYENKKLSTENLNIKFNNSTFILSGFIQAPINYFIEENETLTGKINLSSDFLNLSEIIGSYNSTDSSNFQFPDNISLNIISEFKRFEFENFIANDLKAEILLIPNKTLIKSFDCKSMQGTISSIGSISQKTNGIINLELKNRLNNIEIQDLFFSFNNFGQTFIIDENLKGKLNLNFELKSNLNPNFSFIEKSIEVNSNIEIVQGELINFEPMKELSKFIELSELEHIKFSKLENNINIKNESIIIPKMNIYSSALNISISGKHNFNHNFSYKLELFLNEILGKRFRKKNKSENEFGIIENEESNKTKLFLKATGNEENYKFIFDKEAAKKSLVKNIKKEKNEVKNIILDEFEVLKKDTSATKKDKENKIDKENKFRPEWEEFENKQDTLKKKKKKTKKKKSAKKKLQIEWEDE